MNYSGRVGDEEASEKVPAVVGYVDVLGDPVLDGHDALRG